MCCPLIPHVIQGSFRIIGWFTFEHINLPCLLRVLRSQVKTSGLGGLNFERCFEEDRYHYINEREYIYGLCYHIHMATWLLLQVSQIYLFCPDGTSLTPCLLSGMQDSVKQQVGCLNGSGAVKTQYIGRNLNRERCQVSRLVTHWTWIVIIVVGILTSSSTMLS